MARIDAGETMSETMGQDSGLRDALRAALAEFRAEIKDAQGSEIGVARGILAGAQLADDLDTLLNQVR